VTLTTHPPFPTFLVCRLANMACTRTLLFAYSALWLSVDKHFLKIPSLFGSVLRIESTQQQGLYLKFNTLQHEVHMHQSLYRPEVPRWFQVVRVPRLRDNGPGWW